MWKHFFTKLSYLLGSALLFIPQLLQAQDGAEAAQGLDEKIDAIFAAATGWYVSSIFYQIPLGNNVGLYWVLIPLIGGALFFTFYFNFVNIRHFITSLRVVEGRYDSFEKDGHIYADPEIPQTDHGDILETIRIEGDHVGEVTHFQALTAALSGTVGLGNIAGVAVALSLGGPGATFWMIVAGILGMSSKFVECTLGVRYREFSKDGIVYGGPMYYLSKGLKERGHEGIGKILAILFAIMCIGGSFGGGNMFQANQAFTMFSEVTGFESGALFGLVMAILVAIVIIGGIRSIAKVTDKIVPIMVVIYVLAALAILVLNFKLIPAAFSTILEGAFSPQAIGGGFVGVLVQGFRRAAFSNEAGIGSAAIAHSAVKTRYPASEGLVALLEPFIDTVIVCTMTALVIVITNFDGSVLTYGQEVGDGVATTSAAFASGGKFFANFFPYILAIAVILFAFSTMISWSYYGYQAWSYLFGRSKGMEYLYKGIFCLFVIIGAAASLGAVIDFSDAMIFSMMVPNMIGLFFLAPVVKKELNKYLDRVRSVDKTHQ